MYKVAWILAGTLTVITVISFIVLFILLVAFVVKALSRKSVYYTTKHLFGSVLWFTVSIWMLGLQVVGSEMYVYSPGDDGDIVMVDINRSEQYYSVRTMDESQPVILFLAGGPGGSQIPATRAFLSELEDTYTIVNWEQPGVGKSYDAVYRDGQMEVEDYVEDAHVLTQHLKEKYDQEKIYIIGESWGSYLGVLLASLYPEDYYAFIGTGQMVDFTETEQYCYDYAMDLAVERGDVDFQNKLKSMGYPPIYGDNVSLALGSYLQPLYMEMQRHPDINHQDWSTFDILLSPEYSIMNSVNYLRGLYYTFSDVFQTLYGRDLRETHTEFDIPIYILQGKYDINAPLYLASEYYDMIDAPKKEMIIFEHSGHNPWIDEYEAFQVEVRRLFVEHEGA
ncbi:hypothetical protein BK010_09555 [Tenericutes bacterium MO-XQ]|nr:hypothetical protein BK010_09555 [Tenericutes bacterium MO-XQ]